MTVIVYRPATTPPAPTAVISPPLKLRSSPESAVKYLLPAPSVSAKPTTEFVLPSGLYTEVCEESAGADICALYTVNDTVCD